MKLFRNLKRICNPSVVLVYYVLALCVPNVVLCFTDGLELPAAVANVVLPLGVYLLITASRRAIAATILAMFPIAFLCAFQIVLFFLYGGSIIGVDMFLNVVTTSSNEVGELLNNLAPAILVVMILYLPPLLWAVVYLFKHNHLRRDSRKLFLKSGAAATAVGVMALALSYLTVPDYLLHQDLFPVNVVKNLTIAVNRVKENKNYPETSKDFTFEATATHSTSKEIYVVVIGETGRADSYGILGYKRDTTPLLAQNPGVIGFTHVLSESNTTHKSVPMLLSLVDAENYRTINTQKSIITAFKEAGFYTAFISSQPENRSYTDYFGNEADYVRFINVANNDGIFAKDEKLLPLMDKLLAENRDKVAIFIHTYGSHFSYSDRYDPSFAHFTPDNTKDASYDNRMNLRNAYDNAIRHTDYILAEVIRRLENAGDAVAAMMYVSDHGEDLFDDSRKRFLHASPTPTYWQLHVPMVMWMSPSYKETYPDKWETAVSHSESQISSSRSFAATILDLAGVASPKVKCGSSVADANYMEPERYYVSDRNECLPLSDSGFKPVDFILMRKNGIK